MPVGLHPPRKVRREKRPGNREMRVRIPSLERSLRTPEVSPILVATAEPYHHGECRSDYKLSTPQARVRIPPDRLNRPKNKRTERRSQNFFLLFFFFFFL